EETHRDDGKPDEIQAPRPIARKKLVGALFNSNIRDKWKADNHDADVIRLARQHCSEFAYMKPAQPIESEPNASAGWSPRRLVSWRPLQRFWFLGKSRTEPHRKAGL
ncbi:MAG: hypothetical protein ACC631_00665, partial [Halocynthiibacter sp.]